jgi:alanine racemase
METENLNTWVEISEQAYAHNLAFFKKIIPKGTELSVVVKANAYGHGLKEISGLADKHGADSFCVHTLEEAQLLRQWGHKKDVLIMGPVVQSFYPEVIKNNFRLVAFNRQDLNALKKTSEKMKSPVRIHLKLETGTHRQGINPDEVDSFLHILKKSLQLRLDGIYTHFANIEDTTDHSYAFTQLGCFNKTTDRIQKKGFPDILKHAACSAAILLFPETHFDMVRLGISQYGLWPSRETFVSYKIKHSREGEDLLQPVLSWKTRVGQIKTVPANRFIGYGCSYQTTRKTRLAVLPVGYSDGYDRALSNQAFVLLNCRRAPVRGRICMNLTMVDITDIPGIKLGDEAVLIGKQGEKTISVDQLSAIAGTIHYEFISRINGLIPRIVVPN